MTVALLVLVVLALAYANGANDNFKGVATLFGSETTSYRTALVWATATTLLGSLTAVFLAGELLKSFTGKGLVDPAIAATPTYAAAVALAAGATVLLATFVGMPISTTHALVGGLVGAGWAAATDVRYGILGSRFFLPLVVSPFLAIGLTGLLYLVLHRTRRWLAVTEETCLCVGAEPVEVVPGPIGGDVALSAAERLTVSTGDPVTCRERYSGRVVGIEAAWLLDRLHFLSAGIVCFARGLNDTPKIAAMLLLVPAVGPLGGLTIIGVAIALGGLLSARRVAETTSHRITGMNHGQGFTANIVTGLVVIGASRLGLPVSTTHVSCGSLFGLGAITGRANGATIGHVLLAWAVTLPIGAGIAFVAYHGLAAMV